MKLLLDTHVLLWWLDNPAFLTDKARKAIAAGENIVYVSVATIWEIVIKKSLGKLDLPNDLETALVTNRFFPLQITVAHALTIQTLPHLHKDPFDRMLVSQAICEELTLISRDPNVLRYPAALITA